MPTIKRWLSIAEASGLIYLLPAFSGNINKQIVKSPKVYLADTGLAAALLGISSAQEMQNHAYNGALFETFVITEIVKSHCHNGNKPDFYFYRDSTGMEIDLANMIAEYLGVDVEFTTVTAATRSELLDSGDIDCVLATFTITEERKQSWDFTTPYYYASIVCLVDKDSPYASAQGVSDLAGASCTSQMNTIWYDVCLPQIPEANILPAQDSAPAMLVALDSGRVDLVCTDMPTGQAALVAYPDMVLLDFSEGDDPFVVSEEEINIGISLNKNNSELRDAINSVLATLTVDDFTRMMDEAIAVQPLAQ